MKQKIDFHPKLFNLQVLPNLLQCVQTLNEEKEYTLTLETKRKKRSKNANAYMWSLCEQISQALNEHGVYESKEDVYRKAVKEKGVAVDYDRLNPKAAKDFAYLWGQMGIGWFTEIVDFNPDGENLHLRAYRGTSSYNTKEMSRVLDYIIQEAKNLEIDTLTDRERSLLLQGWDDIKKGSECDVWKE